MTDKKAFDRLNSLSGQLMEGGAVEIARKIVEDAPGTALQKAIVQMAMMIVRMGKNKQMSPACDALLTVNIIAIMSNAGITDKMSEEIYHALDLASDYVHSEAQKRRM